MKQTQLYLPSDFPEKVGFLKKVTLPLVDVSGEILAQIYLAKGKQPQTREQINATRQAYRLPEWMGYYCAGGRPYVTDGVHCTFVRMSTAFEQMLSRLQALHFRGRPLPIVGANNDPTMAEPAQILIHHRLSTETYLEPFEGGKLFLRYQRSHNAD